MNKALSLLAAFPLVAAGALVGTSSAQAGILTPPPPDGQVAFSPLVILGQDAGVTLFIRPAGAPPPIPVVGTPGPVQSAFLDFKPPTAGGIGNFKVDNTQPAGGPFAALVPGSPGTIKDFVIPFVGAPTNQPNLNIPFAVSAFLDVNPGDATAVDTFDATLFKGIVAQNVGPGSFISASFEGFWNVEASPGVIEQFAGTVTLSQALVQPIGAVVAAANSPAGFTASYSGQADITSPPNVIPEPSTLAGLAVVAGSAAMTRKRLKKQ